MLPNVPGNVRLGFGSERFLGRLSKFLKKWHVFFNATFRRILTNVPGKIRIVIRIERFLGRLSECFEKWHTKNMNKVKTTKSETFRTCFGRVLMRVGRVSGCFGPQNKCTRSKKSRGS